MRQHNSNVDIYKIHGRSLITLWIAREKYWMYEKIVIYSSLFALYSQNFIKWYERLYHWYLSDILILLFIKLLAGSSLIVIITREEFWVYDKILIFVQFYAIFHFLAILFYKFIWAPLAFLYQQNYDVYINKIHIGEYICFMYHEGGI